MAKIKDLGRRQEDLCFSLCFFVPYDAVRSPVLKSFQKLYAIAWQQHRLGREATFVSFEIKLSTRTKNQGFGQLVQYCFGDR